MSAITIITQHYNRVLDNKDSRKESVQHWKKQVILFLCHCISKNPETPGKSPGINEKVI